MAPISKARIRLRSHCMPVVKSRDPIPTFTTYLRARHVLDDAKLREAEERVANAIDEAVEYATNAPDPKPEDAVTDLYA